MEKPRLSDNSEEKPKHPRIAKKTFLIVFANNMTEDIDYPKEFKLFDLISEFISAARFKIM